MPFQPVSDELLAEIRKNNAQSSLADVLNMTNAFLQDQAGRKMKARREAALGGMTQNEFPLTPEQALEVVRSAGYDPMKALGLMEERSKTKMQTDAARAKSEQEAAAKKAALEETKGYHSGLLKESQAKTSEMRARTEVFATDAQRKRAASEIATSLKILKDGNPSDETRAALMTSIAQNMRLVPTEERPGLAKRIAEYASMGLYKPATGVGMRVPSGGESKAEESDPRISALAAAMSRGGNDWKVVARSLGASKEEVAAAAKQAGVNPKF